MSGREVPSLFRCAIFSCNNYRIKGDRKSFYRFPKNTEICKQWVMRSGNVDLEQQFRTDGPESLHRRYTVCSDHFIEKDFRNKNILRHGIFPGSVPSVLVDTKEDNSMPSLKREEEVGQNESVPDIQMLEVPGHFQKPHEIFISEQAYWSSENSAQEETDPLCLEEEPMDGSAGVASGRTQRVPLATPASQNAPVSESAASITTAVEEASMPKGDAGDTGPGSAVRHCDSTAASPAQKAGGDAEEATDPRVLCPSHERKKVSHSQMVTLAIMDSPDWQLPFREICRYIASNFPWVRSRARWCHSIGNTMSMSPLFVTTRDTNTHRTWTVVAAYAGMLRRSGGPSCCRWERVRWLRVRRPYSPRPAHVDRSAPVSESAASIATAVEEASMPKGDAGDSGPGSAVRHCDSTAASPAQKVGGEAEEATDPRVLCPSHERKKVSPSQMITLAIMDSPDWQLPCREICRYIASNFPWVRSRAAWSNSIRGTVSMSPLFVKTRDTNTHRTWTVVPAYARMLRRPVGPSCCRWERVRRLRLRRDLLCSPLPAGVDRNSSPPTETGDDIRSPLSPAVSSCRVSIPPPNSRRELECRSLSQPVADDCQVSLYVPPLQPIIERAFLESPHSHVPPSEIYAYCIGHCPYYRSRSMQCYRLIKHILKREQCFQRVAPSGSGPECWLFDGRSGDLPEKQSAASRDRGPSHPGPPHPGPSHPGRGAGRAPSRRSRLAKQASQLGSDSDDGQRLRSLRSYAASNCGDRATPSNAASQSGFGPKRPRESWLQPGPLHRNHKAHADYPLPDKPVEVSDELDIKEELFPEEPLTENICMEENGDKRQIVCGTLLAADCSGKSE